MSRHFLPDPAFRAAQAAMNLPMPIVRRMIGEPIQIQGQRLDPYVQFMLMSADRLPGVDGVGTPSTDVAQRRDENSRASAIGMPRAKGVRTRDITIPSPAGPIPARCYRADQAPTDPVALLYFHGGGFVLGDLDSHDGDCRMLARITGATVIAVDYRLAPEHPFPAAVDDATAAFAWVARHPGDLGTRPGAVVVMGDSAGGNLAAVVALRARELPVAPPIAQALVYPATDLRMVERSHELFAEGFFLTREDMQWFRRNYLSDVVGPEHPEVSPLLAADLTGLPPTAIWTAGFDPLRDEGEAYGARLREAGVPVMLRREESMVHGFFGMGVLPGGLPRVARVCWDTRHLVARALELSDVD